MIILRNVYKSAFFKLFSFSVNKLGEEMKKGVFKGIRFFVLCVLCFVYSSFFVCFVYAVPPSGSGSEAGGGLPQQVIEEEALQPIPCIIDNDGVQAATWQYGSDTKTLPATCPLQTNSGIGGYWIAKTIKSDGAENKYYFFGTPLHIPLLAGPFGNDPKFSTSSTPYRKPSSGVWVFDALDAYSSFGLNQNNQEEISSLFFVLDRSPFKIEIPGGATGIDNNKWFSSHSNVDILSTDFREGCVACSDFSLDCLSAQNKDNTCVEIPFGNFKSCVELADANKQFCEGVDGVTPNPSGVVISSIGIPGFGGCKSPVPGSNPVEYKNLGRDWANSSLAFSDSNKFDKDIVGGCCGNDKTDYGALRKDNQYPVENPNHYACVHSMKDTSSYWAKANDIGVTYAVYSLTHPSSFNMQEIQFDGVATSRNWFFCDGKVKNKFISTEESLKKYFADFEGYDENSNAPKGVVLDQFESTQMPESMFNAGISVEPPPEEGAGGSGGPFGTGEMGEDENKVDLPSAESVENNEDIEKVTGESQITPCDKDGDGYDGPYTPDLSLDGNLVPGFDFAFVYDGECESPLPPYDCVDDSEVNVNAAKISPGNVEICDNDINDDCNFDTKDKSDLTGVDTCESPESTFEPGKIDDMNYVDRFICLAEELDKYATSGSFAECCGYTLDWCRNNQPIDKIRRQGSSAKTLREFASFNYGGSMLEPCKNTTNCALRFGVVDPPDEANKYGEYAFGLYTSGNDGLRISDWSGYKYLEFYVHFTGNFIGNIKVGRLRKDDVAQPDPSNPKNYVYYFDEPIIKYVVNGPRLSKWLHVVIPLSEFEWKDKMESVDVVVFAFPIGLLNESTSEVYLKGYSKPFRSVVAIDKIGLVDDLSSGEDRRFCTGTYPPLWIKDLDNAEDVESQNVPKGSMFSVKGWSACQDTPSFGWTGTQCCGDDTGKDVAKGKFGDSAFKEFFNDSVAACVGGSKMEPGTAFTIVKYGLHVPPLDSIPYPPKKDVYRLCKSVYDCSFELPFINSIVVHNVYADVYDLLLLNPAGGEMSKKIAPVAVSESELATIKGERVPLQLLLLKESEGVTQLYGCNAAPYLFESSVLPNTATSAPGDSLLLDDDEHDIGSCDVRGDFFCSHELGNDLGWSNELLTNYSSYPALNVSGAFRVNEKVSYNLIHDPGFEEV